MNQNFHKIRKLRKERGLTLNAVAEKIGTDHQHISRIERGKSKLTVDFLMKLANALDTPVETLIDDSSQTSPSNAILESDLLGVILENIETISDQLHIKIPPRKRAALATTIYESSFKAAASKDPALIQTTFIECSTEILKEILQFIPK